METLASALTPQWGQYTPRHRDQTDDLSNHAFFSITDYVNELNEDTNMHFDIQTIKNG